MKNILDKNQILLMKESGKILKEAIDKVAKLVSVGVTTKYLDEVADLEIRRKGGTPSFKGYEVRGIGKYPAALCVSINEEVVHGLPSEDRIVQAGDIVSLDLGVNYRGVCSDMAITICVGKVSSEIMRLVESTKESLEAAIEVTIAGNRIGAIGHAIETIANSQNFGIVRDLVGHGIGTKPHMDPPIPNFGNNDEGPVIAEGMALAIEPMLTLGGHNVVTARDGWTIVTEDGSPAAHFEHTVVIIGGRPVVVTA